tara:strand:+ start:13870 stop:14205 length:336 start_codon:yes stop_codon:yes gene_type:complete
MPFINVKISTSLADSTVILKKLSKALSNETGKSEDYVMTSIETNNKMTFAGSEEPCCFIQIKSIGAIHAKRMSEVFTKLIAEDTSIDPSRIYIEFKDVESKYWAWKGFTFG